MQIRNSTPAVAPLQPAGWRMAHRPVPVRTPPPRNHPRRTSPTADDRPVCVRRIRRRPTAARRVLPGTTAPPAHPHRPDDSALTTTSTATGRHGHAADHQRRRRRRRPTRPTAWRDEVAAFCTEPFDGLAAIPPDDGSATELAEASPTSRPVLRRRTPFAAIGRPAGHATGDRRGRRHPRRRLGYLDTSSSRPLRPATCVPPSDALDEAFDDVPRIATASRLAGAPCDHADPARVQTADLNVPTEWQHVHDQRRLRVDLGQPEPLRHRVPPRPGNRRRPRHHRRRRRTRQEAAGRRRADVGAHRRPLRRHRPGHQHRRRHARQGRRRPRRQPQLRPRRGDVDLRRPATAPLRPDHAATRRHHRPRRRLRGGLRHRRPRRRLPDATRTRPVRHGGRNVRRPDQQPRPGDRRRCPSTSPTRAVLDDAVFFPGYGGATAVVVDRRHVDASPPRPTWASPPAVTAASRSSTDSRSTSPPTIIRTCSSSTARRSPSPTRSSRSAPAPSSSTTERSGSPEANRRTSCSGSTSSKSVSSITSPPSPPQPVPHPARAGCGTRFPRRLTATDRRGRRFLVASATSRYSTLALTRSAPARPARPAGFVDHHLQRAVLALERRRVWHRHIVPAQRTHARSTDFVDCLTIPSNPTTSKALADPPERVSDQGFCVERTTGLEPATLTLAR